MLRTGVHVSLQRRRDILCRTAGESLNGFDRFEGEPVCRSGESVQFGTSAVDSISYRHVDEQSGRDGIEWAPRLLHGGVHLGEVGRVGRRNGWVRQPSVIVRAGTTARLGCICGEPHRRPHVGEGRCTRGYFGERDGASVK